MPTYAIAFDSTHAAMAAQRVLEDAPGFALIPTPASIDAGCGMSVLMSAPSDEDACALARTAQAARGMAALYRRHGAGFDASYERVARI